MNNFYKESDKFRSAYLLTCKNIRFEGTEEKDDILYFLFSPAEEVEKQLSFFFANQAAPIQPRELVDSIESIGQMIWNYRKNKQKTWEEEKSE